VPEILLPFYVWHFAQSSYERALSDLISAAGLIVPTELTRLDAASSRIKSESVKYVIKADFLHDPQNFEEYYFDAEGNLLGKYENYADLQNRLWEKSTMKQIIFYFGDLFQSPEKVAQQRRFSEQTIILNRQEI
jgi:hypothetical protein